jgi:hypothetical protein
VPRSGAKYGSLFEQMEAAHWRGLSDQEFSDLSVFEQARVVAHYRAHHQLEAVVADAQMKRASAEARRHQAK